MTALHYADAKEAVAATTYLHAQFWERVGLFVRHQLRQDHRKGDDEAAEAYNKRWKGDDDVPYCVHGGDTCQRRVKSLLGDLP